MTVLAWTSVNPLWSLAAELSLCAFQQLTVHLCTTFLKVHTVKAFVKTAICLESQFVTHACMGVC